MSSEGGSERDRKKEDETTSHNNWREFTSNASFHGVKYIFNTSFGLRKIIWALVVVSATGLFAYQVIDRSRAFARHESSVNVEVIYEGQLPFPAVTICNQNSFRITSAVENNMYEFLDKFYGAGYTNGELLQFNHDHHGNMTALLLQMAHQMKDLVISCRWKGAPCDLSTAFKVKMTDFGICYTFNSEEEHQASVSESGASKGLSLTLNVEQYEYMRGPWTDAGIKVMLHDQSEEPLVKDQGFAIAPGSHTLVGVKRIQVAGLEPPYGFCDKKTRLMLSTCTIQCQAEATVARCGCRDIYMPEPEMPESSMQHVTEELQGGVPVCNLSLLFGCARKDYKNSSLPENPTCKCPVPCERTLFEPSLSYGRLASLNVDRMLGSEDNDLSQIQAKLKEALEVSHRAVDFRWLKTEKLVANFNTSYGVLHDHIGTIIKTNRTFPALSSVIPVVEAIDKDIKQIQGKFNKKRKSFDKKKIQESFRIMDSGFASTEELNTIISRYISEKSLLSLLQNCQQKNLTWNECRNRTADANLWNYVRGRTFPVVGIALMAIQRSTFLSEYLSSKQAVIRLESTWNTSLRTCLDLIARVNETMYDFYNASLIFRDDTEIGAKVDSFSQMLQMSRETKGVIRQAQSQCVWFEEPFDSFSESLETMVASASEKIARTQKYVSKTRTFLHQLDENLSSYIFTYLNISLNYINHDVTLHDVAELVTSQAFSDSLQKLDILAKDSKTALHETNLDLAATQLDLDTLLTAIENFDFVFLTMNDTENSNLVDNFRSGTNDTKVNVSSIMFPLSVLSDLQGVVNSERKQLDAAAQQMALHGSKWREFLEAYLNKAAVDETFVMNNILQIDVFYQQLNYELIKQQVAFGFLSLLSEIGGFLGLLLGASVLSLFEIVDFLALLMWKRVKVKEKTESGAAYREEPSFDKVKA